MSLFALKLVHSLIAAINSAAVVYILYCGLTNRRGPVLAAALGALFIETAALLMFCACPLQLYARRLQNADGPVADTFLPNWIAANIVEFFTPIAILGVALVVRNELRRRKQK